MSVYPTLRSRFSTANPRGYPTRPQAPQPLPRQPYSCQSTTQQKPFCSPCFDLGKKLNLPVFYYYHPQSTQVRHLQTYTDQLEDDTHQQEQEGEVSHLLLETISSQTNSHVHQKADGVSNLPNNNDFIKEQKPLSTSTNNTPMTWLIKTQAQILKIEYQVRKEKSPSL